MLLGGVGRVQAVALIGADRLVLDAVVRGQISIAKRSRRRQHSQEADHALPQGAATARRVRPSEAADRSAGRGGGERDHEDPRVLDREPSRRQATAGQRYDRERLREPQRTAKQRNRAQPPAPEHRLGAGRHLDVAVTGPSCRRPGSGAVNQQPVAKRHPTEPKWLAPGAVTVGTQRVGGGAVFAHPRTA